MAIESQGSLICAAIIMDDSIMDDSLAATCCSGLDYCDEVLNIAPSCDWCVYVS